MDHNHSVVSLICPSHSPKMNRKTQFVQSLTWYPLLQIPGETISSIGLIVFCLSEQETVARTAKSFHAKLNHLYL